MNVMMCFSDYKCLKDGFGPRYTTGVSKKMVFCGKTAITSFKIIQNAKSGGVLENSGYLLRYGH